MLELFSNPQTYISLLSLVVLLMSLDVDNVIFMTIITGKLKDTRKQHAALRLSLLITMAIRCLMLLGVGYLAQLKATLFTIAGIDFTAQSLILLVGGVFLLAKSTLEIHSKIEDAGKPEDTNLKGATFTQVLTQLVAINLIFSIDSVVTAFGMVPRVEIMIVGMLLSMLVVFIFAYRIGAFIQKHPTMKMLALSFLLLIGVLLVAESIHYSIPKGYIYFAMSFSFIVEMLNINYRKRANKGTTKAH